MAFVNKMHLLMAKGKICLPKMACMFANWQTSVFCNFIKIKGKTEIGCLPLANMVRDVCQNGQNAFKNRMLMMANIPLRSMPKQVWCIHTTPGGWGGVYHPMAGWVADATKQPERVAAVSRQERRRHPDHIDDVQEVDMAVTTLPQNGADGNRALLALDLGSKTGWALRQADGTITSGTVEFRPGRFEGGGMAFVRFKHWLEEVRGFAGPLGAVYFEEVRAHAGVTAAHVYGGFLAHLTAWAEQHELPYQGVPVGTIKRHATGKGNASKEEVIEAMRRKGHTPADDNAADALAILHWALDKEVLP